MALFPSPVPRIQAFFSSQLLAAPKRPAAVERRRVNHPPSRWRMEQCRQHPGGGVKIEMNSTLNKNLGANSRLTPIKFVGNYGVKLGIILIIVFAPYLRSEVLDWNDLGVQTNSTANLLKMFISSPPQAGEMSFSQRQLFQLPNAKGSNRTVFFVSKWQSPKFYLAQVATNLPPNLVNQSNLMDMGGFFGNNPWYFGRGVLKMMEGNPNQNIDTDGQLNHHYYESRFLAAQSFGLMHKPGTLVWDGLRFRAKTYDGEDFHGELILDNTGLPIQISEESMHNNKPYRFVINLGYSESKVGIKLPEFYTSVMLDNEDKQIPIAVC